jgi:DNA invertase Pin-like site-specific DNA recombinase
VEVGSAGRKGETMAKAKQAGKVAGAEGEAPLRAAIYCRKSNDDHRGGKSGKDEDASLSVKAQELDCKAVIEREGWSLVAVYADDGISGRTWPSGKYYDALAEADSLTKDYVKNMAKKHRPGLGRLLDSVGRHEIDVIVVRDMPRLARPVFQSALQNFLPSFIQSNEVRIYSLADGMIDYSDFGKSLALFLADALLDRELKTRAKHSKEAKKREWAKGRFIANHIPFGYVRDKSSGKLVQHPENSAIMKDFLERCANGVSTAMLVKTFNAKGMKSPMGKSLRLHSLRGMLQNPIYCGKLNIDGRLIKCIDIDDPIIPERLYYKIAKLFDSRKGIASNRAKSSGGLASGIVRCGLCGYAMIHWYSSCGYGYRRYLCSMKTSTKCNCAISAGNLEEFVNYFTPLKGILEHRQIITDAREKKQLPELRERESLLVENRKKLMERVLKDSIDDYLDEIVALRGELRKVQQRIVELENIPDIPIKEEKHGIYFEELDEVPSEGKRDAVRSVFKKVEVFKEKVSFHLASGESFTVKRIPLGNKRIWIPPASLKVADAGESLTLSFTHGLEKTLTLLEGRLRLVKVPLAKGEEKEVLATLMKAKDNANKMKKHTKAINDPKAIPDELDPQDDPLRSVRYRLKDGKRLAVKPKK